MTLFVDLSHHQASVDLPTYARSCDRIALKATEGTTYVDPTFVGRWRAAGSLGLARVAYHFARANNSGGLEFDHLWSVVSGVGFGADDWLCLDSEDTTAPGRAVAHAREFTSRAVTRGQPDGLVYTGGWYAQPNGLTASALATGWRRLWLSDYTSAHSDTTMPLPAGWSRDQVYARQYTSTATVAGIGSPCDANRVIREWLTTSRQDPDMSAAELAIITDKLDGIYKMITVGDSADDAADTGTHPNNLQRVLSALEDVTRSKLLRNDVQQLAALSALAGQLAALTTAVNQTPAGGLTAEELHGIALEAAREAVDGITVIIQAARQLSPPGA